MDYTIEHEEMRAIRRAWINTALQIRKLERTNYTLTQIKHDGRMAEVLYYGREMKAYA